MKSLFVLFSSILSLQASAAKFTLDKAHTEIGFSVKHLMIANVKGHFKTFDGGFNYDDKAKTIDAIQINIEPLTIDTNHGKRDDHLRSGDFFATAENKTMSFKAEKITGVEEGKTFKAPGQLTIRGVTKPVTLDVDFRGSMMDAKKGKRIVFVATGKINRKDFGVSWQKAIDGGGGVVVGEEVSILIEAQAVEVK